MTFLDDIRKIEKKWQKKWKEDQVFVSKISSTKPKWFLTVPYPYASVPLHIGHCRTYNLGDIFARYKRQSGYNVFWPMAFHITGTPVQAVAYQIKIKDEKVWKTYEDYVSIYEKDQDKVRGIVESFENQENVASFFANAIIQDFLGMGFSLDDTRQFTTGDKEYNKFIEWQYRILNEKNLITKGSYPILWCINDKNAVGEDDIQDGDLLKVEVNEFVGIKFRLNSGSHLVAATLRPETIYGATNVWINPNADYNEIEIDGEKWVVSRESTEKLREQEHEITILREVKGKEFVNEEVTVPITEEKIPIYPATFVDTDHATGVVYSVPAHAPYDYAALVDLQNDKETIKEYNLNKELLEQIKPISLISVKGYGDFPAVELCDMLGVKSQEDKQKLEKATQTIYKDEYYSGIMKEITGKFKGLKVEEAKDAVAKKLKADNLATEIYETSKKAFCRCGGQIIVAVLQDQYFLNYGDKKWKQTAFNALNKMVITPDKYRQTFENTFNWLDKRPCVRKRGLGTEFPLTKGEGWIIESLSDSVIYMAFYTIIRTIRENNIKPEQLKPELFDHIFLDKGKLKDVSTTTNVEEAIINEMKESFEYYYPNDLRHTAIAHISNHLSFAIFHHVAVFPEKYWLPAFSLNEMLIREGQKMGKSKGNVIPIAQIPEKYSVDLTRLHLASIATADTIVDWRETEVNFALQRLRKFWEYANRSVDVIKTEEIEPAFPSQIFQSSVKTNLKRALNAIKEFNVRDYVLEGFYANIRAIDEYQKIAEHLQREERESILKQAIEQIVVVMAPVIPHISEELHEKMGNQEYVSLVQFPEIKITKEDKQNALQAKFIGNLLEDIDQIVKLVKTTPKKIHIYINADWKNELYQVAQDIFENEAVKIGKIMSVAKENKSLSKYMKEIANEAKQMLRDPSIFRIEMLSSEKQKNAIEGYKEFISRTYVNSEIHVHIAGNKDIYDPQNKAQKARPMKPALLLE